MALGVINGIRVKVIFLLLGELGVMVACNVINIILFKRTATYRVYRPK